MCHGWKILNLEDESFGVWAKGGKDVRVWERKKRVYGRCDQRWYISIKHIL
jgi:hypothetical protein